MPRTVTMTHLGLALTLALVACTSPEAGPVAPGGAAAVRTGSAESPSVDDAAVEVGTTGLVWSNVTTPTELAVGHGYVVDAAVRLVLPATAGLAIGEEIEVLGRGVPFEIVLRGADDAFAYAPGLVSEDWADRIYGTPAKDTDWGSLATDATGETVFAVAKYESVWSSKLGGLGLRQVLSTTGSQNYSSVATDVTGTSVFLSLAGYSPWCSTNGGDSWVDDVPVTPPSETKQYDGASMNADASQVLMVDRWGYVYRGTRGATGYTFVPVPGAGRRDWRATASDATGEKVVAVAFNEGIYTSADHGQTWTEQTGIPVASWRSVASSADGKRLYVASEVDGLAVGTFADDAWSWETVYEPPVWGRTLFAVATSADGSKVYVGGPDGLYEGVFDDGRWKFVDLTTGTSRANRVWTTLATNATGSVVYAGAAMQEVWSYSRSRRRLAVTPGGTVRLVYVGAGKFDIASATGRLALQ